MIPWGGCRRDRRQGEGICAKTLIIAGRQEIMSKMEKSTQ